METSFKENYRIKFAILLKSKPDCFFTRPFLYKRDGKRGSWTPTVQEEEYQLEKKRRNLH